MHQPSENGQNPPPGEIELRPAFTFDCDHCGRENFFSATVRQHSQIDLDATDDEFYALNWLDEQDEPGQAKLDSESHLMQIPTIVECGHCGSLYFTRYFIEPEEQEDE